VKNDQQDATKSHNHSCHRLDMPPNGFRRRGVVWCGVVWCGVVWCGVVWCGVVWCGVVTTSSGLSKQVQALQSHLWCSSVTV
jgi:hypothetical protein